MIRSLAIASRDAAFRLSQAADETIDAILSDLEQSLCRLSHAILAANAADIAAAQNLLPAMLDRMTLNAARIAGMAESVAAIRALPHPAGRVLETWSRPNGLTISKVSVPIGVIGMIYESRPNVTIDAAALCLKSRNAVILRGGSECRATSEFLQGLVTAALEKNGLPSSCVAMAPTQDRAFVGEMLGAAGLIDVIIPRGGKGLTSRVMDEAKMPVFAHLDGNCHVYVHESADKAMALSVIKNAKLRRTGVCGAAESLLLDDGIETGFAREILAMLLEDGVEIAGDGKTQALDKRVMAASEEDWSTEYLDKKISCRFVNGVGEAVAHINHYGSHHTDCILSTDKIAADYFLRTVDSAIVVHNASTQFADGGEFGFGAEIGIGTGKLHARGPVGLRELCTFKYVVSGDGQIRPV